MVPGDAVRRHIKVAAGDASGGVGAVHGQAVDLAVHLPCRGFRHTSGMRGRGGRDGQEGRTLTDSSSRTGRVRDAVRVIGIVPDCPRAVHETVQDAVALTC